MKKQIILTYIVVCLCNIGMAQVTTSNTCPPTTKTEEQQNQTCEEGKGIRTNPSNPSNTECPILINNFDWKLKQPISGNIIEEVYSVYDADNIYRTIRNPFDDNTNSDYRYLALKQNSNYYPEDGWELLKVDFGTLGNIGLGVNEDPGRNTDVVGPRLPYMILYNKYSGTFRFFGSLLGQMEGYQTIRIELRIPEKSPNYPASPNDYQAQLKATNLLSIQGETVQPLDQETDENVMVVFASATNNSNKFFWFDIPVAYDPCLCNIRSQLDITFAFVKTANIALNGSINAGIKTESKPDNTPYAVKVSTRVLAAGISTALAVKTGGAVINFKAYSDLVKLIRENPNATLSQEQKDNLTTLEGYLDCGAKFAQGIHKGFPDIDDNDKKKRLKAANDILDANTTFLSSLANGCSKQDNGATTISGAVNMSGTWTEEQVVQGSEIILAVPGSNWDDRMRFIRNHTDTENDEKTIAAYPTYNERLGTFALMRTPEFIFSTFYETHIPNVDIPIIFGTNKSVYSLELTEDLVYTLNPNLNLNMDKTKILCRIVVKKNGGYEFANSSSFKLETIIPDVDDNNFGYCNVIKHNLNFSNRNIITSPNNLYPISTPFIPIDQFKSMPIVFSTIGNINNFKNQVKDSIFIQFKILAVSNDIGTNGENSSYLVYTYPIKLLGFEFVEPHFLAGSKTCSQYSDFVNTEFIPSISSRFAPNRPNLISSNKHFDNNTNFTEDEILAFDGVVTISAKLSTNPGKRVKIYSTMGFEIEPGAEIDPNIELIVGFPFEVIPQPPQTYSQVAAFCADNTKYRAQEFTAAAIQREREEYKRRSIEEEKRKKEIFNKNTPQIHPNPNKGSFNISYQRNLASDANLVMLDITGREVYRDLLKQGNSNYAIHNLNLTPGVYFVTISNQSEKQTFKIIIQE